MESPVQTATRLLGALEEIASQEAAAVLAGDHPAVESLQVRAAALGEKLCELAGQPAVLELRSRVEAVLARRQESQAELRRRLTAGRAEIQRLQTVKQRLVRLAPAYGIGGVTSSRLNAAA